MSLTLIFACQGRHQASDLTSDGVAEIHGVANRLLLTGYKPDIVLTSPLNCAAQSAQVLAHDFGEVPVAALEAEDVSHFWNVISTENPQQHKTIVIIADSKALDMLTRPFDPLRMGAFISAGQCHVTKLDADSWSDVATQARQGHCRAQLFRPI